MTRNLVGYFNRSQSLRSFFWNLSGNLFSKGAVFITSLIAANMLGPEDFGRIGIIQQTTGLMITFSVMGLSQTAILFVGKNLNSTVSLKASIVSRVNTIGGILSMAVCAIYLLVAEFIATRVFDDVGLKHLLQICSFVLIGNTFNQIQFGILSGLGRFDQIASTNIAVGLISVPLTYAFMKWLGIDGFVWALVINCWLTYVLNRINIKKELRFDGRQNREEHAPSYFQLIKYASSNVVGAFLFVTSSWYAIGTVSRNSGLIEVAAVNASMQIFSILYLVPTMLAQVLMSVVAREGLNAGKLKRVIAAVFVFVSVLSFVCGLYSDTIISLYGHEFKGYASTLNWVLAVVVLASIINILDHYANGLGMIQVRMVSHIVFFIVYMLLAFFTIIGSKDLAVSMFAAYFVRAVVVLFLLRNKLYN